MKIKVCGMKHPENVKALGELNIDYMGLIFYPQSPRYVDQIIEIDIPPKVKKVGVFVDANKEFIMHTIKAYALDAIQLHGSESPAFCKEFSNITIIKAFSISDENEFDKVNTYDAYCNFFLFDTQTPQYGGSGQKFDWTILSHYKGKKPFFLSGGISETDVEEIKKIKHPAFYGIDLNSKFEIEPALKNINKLKQFIKNIQS